MPMLILEKLVHQTLVVEVEVDQTLHKVLAAMVEVELSSFVIVCPQSLHFKIQEHGLAQLELPVYRH
jgi:hypothetical protein